MGFVIGVLTGLMGWFPMGYFLRCLLGRCEAVCPKCGGPMSEEGIASIEQGLADLRAGRVDSSVVSLDNQPPKP